MATSCPSFQAMDRAIPLWGESPFANDFGSLQTLLSLAGSCAHPEPIPESGCLHLGQCPPLEWVRAAPPTTQTRRWSSGGWLPKGRVWGLGCILTLEEGQTKNKSLALYPHPSLQESLSSCSFLSYIHSTLSHPPIARLTLLINLL